MGGKMHVPAIKYTWEVETACGSFSLFGHGFIYLVDSLKEPTFSFVESLYCFLWLISAMSWTVS